MLFVQVSVCLLIFLLQFGFPSQEFLFSVSFTYFLYGCGSIFKGHFIIILSLKLTVDRVAKGRVQIGKLDERQVTRIGLNAFKSEGIQGKHRGSTSKDVTPVIVKGACLRALTCRRAVSQILALPPRAELGLHMDRRPAHFQQPEASGQAACLYSPALLTCRIWTLSWFPKFCPWIPSNPSPLAVNYTRKSGSPQALSMKSLHESSLRNLMFQMGKWNILETIIRRPNSTPKIPTTTTTLLPIWKIK